MARAAAPIPAGHKALIVGLGATGLSAARFLHKRGVAFAVTDERESPPAYDALMTLDCNAEVYLGGFDEARFLEADDIILSPGVPLKTPAVSRAASRGKPVIGDIELFARCVAPGKVVAITGSNGKSTVTTLLAEMAAAAGLRAAVGGNLGPPALDLLGDAAASVYILELSSFQLETTFSLQPLVSVVLNVSEDHLDRYETTAEYLRAKLGVHRNSKTVVVNREEAFEVDAARAEVVSFGLDAPAPGHFGVVVDGGRRAIACGARAWLDCDEVPLVGESGLLNVQAAFALGRALRLPRAVMVESARRFSGLAHRMQRLGRLDGVEWFDDSKATNVAAAISALHAVPGKAVVICGGDGKGAGFGALGEAVARHARAAVLLGRDAGRIAQAIAGRVPTVAVEDMRGAVREARKAAKPGDCVLLSPACASFDLYRDYAERGDVFAEAFRELR